MKERPILFNGQMVKAILEGHKTQTRRAIKPQPFCPRADLCLTDPVKSIWTVSPVYMNCSDAPNGRYFRQYTCPYGQLGGQLWVKETFAKDNISLNGFIYRQNCPLTKPPKGWTPSIHMPRKASRITLEITAVRVERLQAISKADVLSEGTVGSVWLENGSIEECHACFRQGWESIYGKDSWDKNPWVWVIEFKRIKP